jgi:hypothetical protein
MKTAALTLAGFLIAFSDCRAQVPTSAPSPSPFPANVEIVMDKKNHPAVDCQIFCEKGETVLEVFLLGKDKNDDGETYLYRHEIILPDEDRKWVKFPFPLKGCDEIEGVNAPKCKDGPSKFTRTVQTGSGREGGTTGGTSIHVTFTLYDHGGDLKYTVEHTSTKSKSESSH